MECNINEYILTTSLFCHVTYLELLHSCYFVNEVCYLFMVVDIIIDKLIYYDTIFKAD